MCSLWHRFKVCLKVALDQMRDSYTFFSAVSPWEAHALRWLKEVCTSCCESIGHLCNLLVGCLQPACNLLVAAYSWQRARAMPELSPMPCSPSTAPAVLRRFKFWALGGFFVFFFQWCPVQAVQTPQSSICSPGPGGAPVQAPQGPLGCSGSPASEKV